MRGVAPACVAASLMMMGTVEASAQTFRQRDPITGIERPTTLLRLGQPGSFPLHEQHGSATLTSISGINSPMARMVGEYTRADIKEMCERVGWKFYSPSHPFRGVFEDKRTIAICREKEEERAQQLPPYDVRANCPERLLRTPLGYTFRRTGSLWESAPGRPAEAEFSVAFLAILDRQFNMLCPDRNLATASAAFR